MKPTFFLKQNPKTKSALVIFQLKYNGQKLVYSTKCNLSKEQKKYWTKSQRIKDCDETRANSLFLLNKFFDNLQETAMRTWYEQKALGPIPDPAQIKYALDKFTNVERKTSLISTASFYDLLDDFIENRVKLADGTSREPNTLKGFYTLKTHLVASDPKQRLGFDDFTKQWRDRYLNFLQTEWNPKKPLGKGSIKADLDKLKTVLAEAVERGLTQTTEFTRTGFSTRATTKIMTRFHLTRSISKNYIAVYAQ